MRPLLTIIGMACLVPLLLSSTCLTVDPPRPDRLSAPIFIEADIVLKKFDGEIREMVRVAWEPDSTDTISVIFYQVLRQVDTDSLPTPIINIPDTVTELFEPVYQFNLANRTNEHLISYWIFAIDSLERRGDTSAAFIVELAREVDLLSPITKLTDSLFSWGINDIKNQSRFHAFLWKPDAILWESDTINEFIGGNYTKFNRFLPPPLHPLETGEYFWGVELTIVGGLNANDPKSITITKFSVE